MPWLEFCLVIAGLLLAHWGILMSLRLLFRDRCVGLLLLLRVQLRRGRCAIVSWTLVRMFDVSLFVWGMTATSEERAQVVRWCFCRDCCVPDCIWMTCEMLRSCLMLPWMRSWGVLQAWSSPPLMRILNPERVGFAITKLITSGVLGKTRSCPCASGPGYPRWWALLMGPLSYLIPVQKIQIR
jgi:hypothetical protein